jgi:hypothetical protein
MDPATATALLEGAKAAGAAGGGAGAGAGAGASAGASGGAAAGAGGAGAGAGTAGGAGTSSPFGELTDLPLRGGGQQDDEERRPVPPVLPDAEDAERAAATTVGALIATGLLPLLLAAFALATIVAIIDALNPFGGGDGDGQWAARWPVSEEIPAVYRPMYEAAAEHYGVNPYLLASIHKQESDFSRNPTVRSGTNFAGAAGPMQFLLSTWRSHHTAFRAIKKHRPGEYPLARRSLPSCDGVPENDGCVYDDFDAIAGAAHKLKADGADRDLDSAGTRRAVCSYIGACSEVDVCTGSVNQYCQVLPRARRWEVEAGRAVSGDAEAAVRWALGQEGVVEQPKGSDCGGPINGWQRRAGTPCGTAWCGVFVHEAFLQAGIDLPWWIVSVPQTLTRARAGEAGMRVIDKHDIKRGDIVIFQWDSGDPDHMGLATGSFKDGRLPTIEGNTSHGVHRRSQPSSVVVAGVRVGAAA